MNRRSIWNAYFKIRTMFSILHDRYAPKCLICNECMSCNLRPCRNGEPHASESGFNNKGNQR